MTREELRRENARKLASGKGGKADFARIVSMEPSQVSQLIGPNPNKNIGNSIARRIERAYGLPEGWLDEPHLESPERSTDDEPAAINDAADVIASAGRNMVGERSLDAPMAEHAQSAASGLSKGEAELLLVYRFAADPDKAFLLGVADAIRRRMIVEGTWKGPKIAARA